MKTDDLVRLLAADACRIESPLTTIARASVLSGAAACLAFVALVGVRPVSAS